MVLEYGLPVLFEASLEHLQNYIASERLQQDLHKIFKIDILCETIATLLHQVLKATL